MDDEDNELNALYAVVGRLVVEYARAEAYVHLLACRVLGDDAVGLVVFNTMRLGDLTDRIRWILRAKKFSDEDYTDINSCLTQLAQIGKVRQKLAHRFVELGDQSIQTHNLYTAKTVEGREIDEFEPFWLNAMIADCQRIRRRIQRHTDGEAKRRERYDSGWLETLFAPWRYTPPEPNPQRAIRPAKPLKP
jgi:hypothetical protein